MKRLKLSNDEEEEEMEGDHTIEHTEGDKSENTLLNLIPQSSKVNKKKELDKSNPIGYQKGAYKNPFRPASTKKSSSNAVAPPNKI